MVISDSSAAFEPVQPEFFLKNSASAAEKSQRFGKYCREMFVELAIDSRVCSELVLVGCVLKICLPHGQTFHCLWEDKSDPVTIKVEQEQRV